eukprot:scaffold172958_cov36-Tisochrysis_lutea.AAC.4
MIARVRIKVAAIREDLVVYIVARIALDATGVRGGGHGIPGMAEPQEMPDFMDHGALKVIAAPTRHHYLEVQSRNTNCQNRRERDPNRAILSKSL